MGLRPPARLHVLEVQRRGTRDRTILAVPEVPQGWCADPRGRHEERWMSQGEPTDLVRDRGVESRDPEEDEAINRRSPTVDRPSKVASVAVAAAPDWARAATGVAVRAHTSVDTVPSTGRSPRRLVLAAVRALVPTVIVALLVVLMLGAGAGSIVVLLALIGIAGVIWYSVQRQKSVSRGLYMHSPSDWMSRSCYYEGPFDQDGLPGAASFERQHGIYNNPPQIRLVVTSDGIVFGPAGHSGTPMSVPFAELQSVDLFPGSRRRMVVVTPATGNRLGVVVLTTTAGKVARFSGLPTEGLQAALVEQGAAVTD